MRMRVSWLDDTDLDIFNMDMADIEEMKVHPVTEGCYAHYTPENQYVSSKNKKRKKWQLGSDYDEYVIIVYITEVIPISHT